MLTPFVELSCHLTEDEDDDQEKDALDPLPCDLLEPPELVAVEPALLAVELLVDVGLGIAVGDEVEEEAVTAGLEVSAFGSVLSEFGGLV